MNTSPRNDHVTRIVWDGKVKNGSYTILIFILCIEFYICRII